MYIKYTNTHITMPSTCIHQNCTRRPSYNLPNEKTPLYCKEHIKENMVDIISKHCLYENCTRGPSYNIPTVKTALYCKEHKQNDMVDVKSKRCLYENCTKRPSYNIPTEIKPLYCKEHKQDDMINELKTPSEEQIRAESVIAKFRDTTNKILLEKTMFDKFIKEFDRIAKTSLKDVYPELNLQ